MKNWLGKRYHHLNAHFQERFGEKVYRVAVDAGFSCPNRDGTKGRGGCVYCGPEGSRASYVDRKLSVTGQILAGMKLLKQRTGASRFIAYFQAFSGTYADPERLEKIYLEALSVPGVAGIAIGTRPDCVNDAVLDMLEKIAGNSYVLIEYGVQSMKEGTLREINRRHTAQETVEAVRKTRQRPSIETLAHLIFGLPNETMADMEDSIRQLVDLGVGAFKFHHLFVEKDTELEKMYYADRVKLLSLEEYLEILVRIIARLPERIVLHRLFGECAKERLVAPAWTANKAENILKLEKILEERSIVQGCALTGAAG